MKSVMVVLGTRPEIIKMVPIVRALQKNKILASMETALAKRKELPRTSPFGDGTAAEKIIETIQKEFFPV